jgi:ankyrin repeat protein
MRQLWCMEATSKADEHGGTPLILASQSGHVKCLALLLDRATDPNLANSSGTTAAHRACQNGHLKCLQLLDKRWANVNLKDCYGRTPLDWARMAKQPECVDLLLSSGRSTGMPVEDLPPVSEAEKVGMSFSQCFAYLSYSSLRYLILCRPCSLHYLGRGRRLR